jgi:hypothetical protein
MENGIQSLKKIKYFRKGDWSDSSSLWTPELRKELKVVDEDDGTFWMSLQDFTKYYQAIYLCKILDDKFPVSKTISVCTN